MAFSDTAPVVERKVKPLAELELKDLQLVALAIAGLVYDDTVPKGYNEDANTIIFELTEWLYARGQKEFADMFTPELSVPAFYIDLDRILAIGKIEEIDDFPVLTPDDLNYTDPATGHSVYRGNWNTAFLQFHTRNRFSRGRHSLDIAVHPPTSKSRVIYTGGSEKISTYTSGWDGHGRYHPNMDEEGAGLIATLAEYGRELNAS